jgi:hypothetical protein
METIGRRIAAVAGGALLVASLVGIALSGAATASPGTVTLTPSVDVTPGSTISVSATGVLGAGTGTPFSGLVAITQCGNADSSGNPLASITASDCDGAAQAGNIKFATASSGTIPATNFTVRESGIGSSARRCVPVPPATLPCQLGIGDVGTQGATVALTGTYTLAGSGTTTTTGATTTTTGATTTTTGATTTTTGATTTTTGATTTTIGATTTTAPVTTQPPTTTAPAATKTYDCTDIPLAPTKLVVTPNRCLTTGQTVQVSAPPGTFAVGELTAQVSAFVVQCNPDPAIPTASGAGCNLTALKTAVIGADGSMAATGFVVATGVIGSDPSSSCPPTTAQVSAGTVTCVVAASPGGDATSAIAAGITFDGETTTLPVDFTPTTPGTPGGGGGSGTVGAQTVVVAPAATTARQLAFTGPGARMWWIVGLALAVLDLGYLAISATWTDRRRGLRRSAR